MALKEPYHVILIMKTDGTLENWEGLDTHQSYKGSGREVVTKQCNYCEVSGNHFNYRHQFDDNNNRLHCPIYLESYWATNYCPDRCHAYFLELTEVNLNYLRGYLFDGADIEPQLGFWLQLGWEMVNNTLYE